MSPQPFEAVLFDLGNVLVLHDNQKLLGAFAQAAGLATDEVVRRFEPSFWDEVHRGTLAGDELHRAVEQRLGLRLGRAQLLDLWSCHFTLNPSMLELVSELAAELPLVLVSNTNAWHFDWLRPQLPVLRRFKHLVLSHEVGHIKPEAKIFELALQASGTAPESTLFVDDVADYVAGAERLGIHGHVFTETRRFQRLWRARGLARGSSPAR
jgi:glucose-1-phosphatase